MKPVTAASMRSGQRVPARLGTTGLFSAAWRLGLLTVAVTGAILLTVTFVTKPNSLMFDFRGDLYFAGKALLHGNNPYRLKLIEAMAALAHRGGHPNYAIAVPVYPPPVMLATLPLSLLPLWLADAFWLVASCWALVAGLRLLGVRDWRCTVIVLASYPAVYGLLVGSLSPWLVLVAGLAWRYRESCWVPSVAIGSAVVSKIFPWPLAFWLFATKRFRSLALLLLGIVLVTATAWAVIGFDGLASYPRLLRDLSYVEDPHGVSPFAAMIDHGVAHQLAAFVVAALTAGLLGAAWRFARQQNGDWRAFGLVAMAALVGSPLVWPHYVILVFVPIALASPQLSPLWFSPALLYLSVSSPDPRSLWQIAPWLTLETVVVLRLVMTPAQFARIRTVWARRPFGAVYVASRGGLKSNSHTLFSETDPA